MSIEDLKEGFELLKEGVECCRALLQSTPISQGCIASFEISTAYTNMAIGRKVDRIGERQLVVGLINLLVAVLLLMVLLVK
jgi:predicted MFS family arabinose efflux permease